MNWLIDKATVICVGNMHWFGIFRILVLYCQTVKWDWTELAQYSATVMCVCKMNVLGCSRNCYYTLRR